MLICLLFLFLAILILDKGKHMMFKCMYEMVKGKERKRDQYRIFY